MPLTHLENELRSVARVRIQERRLPSAAPSRMWGGFGHGDACALCDLLIEPGDVEIEIEERDLDQPRAYHFHFLCHAAWTFECARAEHIRKTGKEPG